MIRLPNIGLGNFLKYSRKSGKNPGEINDIIYNDISGIHNFLKLHSGFFGETYSDDTVDPAKSGIDGDNVLISKNIVSGSFFNVDKNRPKTIREVLTDVSKTIDISLSSTNVSTEFLNIKNAIGNNVFDSGQESSLGSIDSRINKLDRKIDQLASDCFNSGKSIGDDLDLSSYPLSGEGGQTQSKSLKDLLNKILEEHGGLANIGHSEILQKTAWAINLQEDEILGGQEKYLAPFGNGFYDFSNAQKFYNPMDSTLKITKLYAYIDKNTLVDNLSITVYKNGSPTNIVLHVAGGKTGSAFNIENEVKIEPNSYIQFKVKAGTVEIGSAHINNISLILQEIN